jgi:formyltetrahydrofolate synthetase
MLDASILHKNPHGIDALRIGWRRAVDMNDRTLREITIGQGGRPNGYPRETGFDITAASEVMAILAIARDLEDLRRRLGAITVAYSFEGEPVTAEMLGAAGAMAVLLKEAIKPNLIQTLEGQPCLMHCGPFANIASGNSSLVADLMAQKLGEYVVTESGFGSDMGMEKFFDIVCRVGGLTPSAVVLVSTVRALKHHGGAADDPRLDHAQAMAAVEHGAANLRRHLQIVKEFGLPCVVAVNRRPGDTNEEVELVRRLAMEAALLRRKSTTASRAAAPARRSSPKRSPMRVINPILPVPLRGRHDPARQDRSGRHPGVRREGHLRVSRRGEEDGPVHLRRDSRTYPCAWPRRICRSPGTRAAQRARALLPSHPRHPRLYGRRVARTALR